MINFKKILLMVMGVSAIIGVIGFVTSKIPAVSGLLAGGALVGALASLGGAFGGGGGGLKGLGLGRNKKNQNDNDKNKKKQTRGGARGGSNHGPRTRPRTTIKSSSSFSSKGRRRRKFF